MICLGSLSIKLNRLPRVRKQINVLTTLSPQFTNDIFIYWRGPPVIKKVEYFFTKKGSSVCITVIYSVV